MPDNGLPAGEAAAHGIPERHEAEDSDRFAGGDVTCLAFFALLVFVFSLGFYVTPALLGGGKTIMIAEYIAVQITDTLNWGVATMLATSLLLTVFGILAVMAFFVDLRKVFGVK